VGGVVVLVGQGPDDVPLPIIDLIAREIEMRGSFRYVNMYPTAVNLLASGRINVKPLITHRFPFEEVARAFEVAHSSPEAIKVIVSID
jgi:L-iditol 2-dehydrogenase